MELVQEGKERVWVAWPGKFRSSRAEAVGPSEHQRQRGREEKRKGKKKLGNDNGLFLTNAHLLCTDKR